MVRLAEKDSLLAEPKHSQLVKVAVIGCGYWGPNLIRNFFEAPGSTVTAACDPRPDRLTPISKRHPTVALTTDYRDVLRSRDVDAVAIATPVSTHFQLAWEALDAGKHVWVEKPLALSTSDALRLTDLAARKGRVLMVDHTFVYTPAVQRIKTGIESGELGKILYYDSVRVNLGLFQNDVNVIWDLGIHDISIIDYVLPQRPVAVTALGARHIGSGRESLAYVSLHFEEDLIAHFHVNWMAPVKMRLTTVCGTRRMVVYDDTLISEKVRIYDRGVSVNGQEEDQSRLRVEYRMGDMYAPKVELTEALQVGARHFASCIVDGVTPLTDGQAGARTVALLEAAQRSLEEDGRTQRVHW